MNLVTPFRYPGGKAGLAPALAAIMTANRLANPIFAEPYAGGAGASLRLLLSERVSAVRLNDLDYRIYAFWWLLFNRTEDLVERVRYAPLSMRQWRLQRDIYRNPRRHKRADVGFATFFLNRTNRSGILINGGPIGGVKQTGEWKLGARFSRRPLVDRIERIAAYRDRVELFNLDAMAFVEEMIRRHSRQELFLYLDPPYYKKGSELYLSDYQHDDHVAIEQRLRELGESRWVVTYDDVPEIRRIYRKHRRVPFQLKYTAQRRRRGSELFILPKTLRMPRMFKVVT